MATKPTGRVLEQQVLETLESATEGLTQDDLSARLGLTDLQTLVKCLNSLTSAGLLLLFQRPGAGGQPEIVFKCQSSDEAQKFKGLTPEDMLVYQLIKQSGNKGIWTKDLKFKTNLPTAVMNKALKELEKRQLVKSVKSVANTRKVYMLFELEPSREVSGGAWYTEHEFDAEFIEVLQRTTADFIAKHPECTAQDIATFIRNTGICKVELTADEVRSIVATLEFDAVIEEFEDHAGESIYREQQFRLPDRTALTSVPCGVCPVLNQCTPGGRVSPATCVYYQAWLDW